MGGTGLLTTAALLPTGTPGCHPAGRTHPPTKLARTVGQVVTWPLGAARTSGTDRAEGLPATWNRRPPERKGAWLDPWTRAVGRPSRLERALGQLGVTEGSAPNSLEIDERIWQGRSRRKSIDRSAPGGARSSGSACPSRARRFGFWWCESGSGLSSWLYARVPRVTKEIALPLSTRPVSPAPARPPAGHNRAAQRVR